jgi:hypothetical protein
VTAATGDGRSFGLPGAVLVIVGAALVLIAFRFLDWYDVGGGTDSAGNATFSKLHNTADQLSGAGAARAYFDWAAWVLVIALVVGGIAANLPVPVADGLRVVGFLIGLIGAGATYFAIAQLHNAQITAGAAKHNLLYNSTWGLWAAFAGYLIGAIGAGLGPRAAKAKAKP